MELLVDRLNAKTQEARLKVGEEVDKTLFTPDIIKELKEAAWGGASSYEKKFSTIMPFNYDDKLVLDYIYNTYKMCIQAEVGIGSKVKYIWGDKIQRCDSRVDSVR